ncbi:MAG: amino acid ABC transporter permease [Clostridia bacterium]|nr:amino acid ABC transporter permease [Clostridia bacterium]MBQ9737828.1 amino acid ABC transporter permease [Clostridia bacterium]
MPEWLTKLTRDFATAFIVDNRWKYLIEGIQNTLILTFFALILGVALGIIIAAIRVTYDKQYQQMKKGFPKFLLCIGNMISKVYLTVIRGTPAMVQILIIFFIIMASSNNKMLCGIIAFGINSGAYVAEIIRGGIMSIDEGQTEAGRSLGFNYVQTMAFIILPQTFKSILPALANEFIVLLKETAIAGYVGVTDLTRGANIIRGITYQSFWPLLAIAAIYLVMVMFFTWLVGILERRLRKNER